MRLFPEYAMEPANMEPAVRITPYVQDACAGMVFERLSDGAKTYIYFNPSTDTDGPDLRPDVFVYEGPTNDPALDSALHFYTPEFLT